MEWKKKWRVKQPTLFIVLLKSSKWKANTIKSHRNESVSICWSLCTSSTANFDFIRLALSFSLLLFNWTTGGGGPSSARNLFGGYWLSDCVCMVCTVLRWPTIWHSSKRMLKINGCDNYERMHQFYCINTLFHIILHNSPRPELLLTSIFRVSITENRISEISNSASIQLRADESWSGKREWDKL